MSIYLRTLISACSIFGVTTMLVLLWEPSHAEEKIPEDIRACRAIEDTDTRAACYDRIVDRQWPDRAVTRQQSDTRASATESTRSTYIELNDEIGRETLDVDDESMRDQEDIIGRIVECRQDARQDYYFYFDNGQVWKQRSDTRLKFDDCNFEVTISKDLFGYKMQQVGERRRIRISRVR